ncbi:MAG TPA: DUF1353 domain-containing protein, partial [Spirochaetota bacterium]|nr:DUF1353 domain-containing protein [Spirochaetota bacterium]
MELKVSFRNNLIISPSKTGHKFVIESPFIVWIDGATFDIPSGFYTDFASIPRAFWSVLSPLDSHIRASVLHDYLYYKQELNNKPIKKAFADQAFLTAMKTCGTPVLKRNIMYYAVKFFG